MVFKECSPHMYVQSMEVKCDHPKTLSSKPIPMQNLKSLSLKILQYLGYLTKWAPTWWGYPFIENSWKTASTMGTLLSTQVPVPMMPWVGLQSEQLEESEILRSSWSPRWTDGINLDHLVKEMCERQSVSCHFAYVLKIRGNPHLLIFMSLMPLPQRFSNLK